MRRNILNCERKSLKIEARRPHLFLETGRFFLIDCFGCPLDQADYIPHPQNPTRQTLRIKRFELLDLLTHARKFYRAFSHFPHRERCSAACIAIQLGENESSQPQRFVEMRRDIDRLLSGRGVAYQKDFLGLQGIPEPLQFVDQTLINFQSASGIENLNIATLCLSHSSESLPTLTTSCWPVCGRKTGTPTWPASCAN